MLDEGEHAPPVRGASGSSTGTQCCMWLLPIISTVRVGSSVATGSRQNCRNCLGSSTSSGQPPPRFAALWGSSSGRGSAGAVGSPWNS